MAKIAVAQFVAKTSSAGIVNVELGFVPDVALIFQDVDLGAAATNQRLWVNPDRASIWTAAKSLLTTGTTGVVSNDDASVTVYAGGDTIAADETTDTAGKHVNLRGLAASAGHITAPGITIPAGDQTAGAKHLVIALQADPMPSQQPAS